MRRFSAASTARRLSIWGACGKCGWTPTANTRYSCGMARACALAAAIANSCRTGSSAHDRLEGATLRSRRTLGRVPLRNLVRLEKGQGTADRLGELGGDTKQLGNKARFRYAVSLCYSPHSALPNQVQRLDPLQRPPRA